MKRVVGRERLDALPPDDPAALANGRDLRLVNRLQGNWRWVAAELDRRLHPGTRILEAGAGDGALGRWLRDRLPVLRRCRYTGLDLRHGRPRDWPPFWEWRRGDLLAYDFARPPDVLLVNFLLHQFDADQLARLGEAIARIPVWIVCEPCRSRRGLVGLALLRPFGLHPVSWHDGRVSVRAGFRGRELAAWLGAILAITAGLVVAYPLVTGGGG